LPLRCHTALIDDVCDGVRMKFFWLVLFCLPLQLWAHGDEDHSADGHDKAVKNVATMPSNHRAYASSDLFELVLVALPADATEQPLSIYLDHYADNSPVADAIIELDIPGFSGKATMLRPGFYQLKLPALQATRHPVTLTIEAGDALDLLSTELDLTPVSYELPHQHSWTEYRSQLWFAAGLLLLALLIWRLAFTRRAGGAV